MPRQIVDLNSFQPDHHFYPPINLTLTVKSFDLQAIRKRYMASRKNKSGKAGSVERRPVGRGGIVSLTVHQGQVSQALVLARMAEPRGICRDQHTLGVAAENRVYLISENGVTTLDNPWFSYIHTVEFSPHQPDRVLVSSSGFDCIFEYDRAGEPCFEWFAWENGFREGHDPTTNSNVLLTRDPATAAAWQQQGRAHLLVDPTGDPLPTAKRAAFINSSCYDQADPNYLLATFFHEGAVYRIDRRTGKASPALEDLRNPHGGRRHGSDFLATSTSGGEVVLGSLAEQTRYAFHHMTGKPEGLEALEWLQNTVAVDNLLITIDSNRTSFVVFDPSQGLVSRIPYDNNWAIQDMVPGLPNKHQLGHLAELGQDS